MKSAKDIRSQFIEFFENHGHTFVPSSPVVPQDDPTLLFTNAGMNQFKDVFLETGTRPYKRAANSQKCIRVSGKHNDLEEVGHDTYHHTYFEMLGNWSFGDYFKKEAIAWAWDLLTEVWGIPKERLYATVFGGDTEDGLEADEEAVRLWTEVTDIDPSHVLRFGKKDNFWEMGDTGPCGPCSEIHIDTTPDLSGGNLVNADDPRVIEIWNLVFIQFNRNADGKLAKLPAQHVDTGMGFERIVRVLQGVASNYDTDVFKPILQHIGELAGISYPPREAELQAACQVIADHIRMLTFSISDGALPSNEGRGYVLRRILRRAARYGRKLGLKEPFIHQLVPTVVAVNGEAFPEIVEKQAYVMEVIKAEEEGFNKTLDRGLELFTDLVANLQKSGETTIPGADAFKLYDTFGFPVDLTRVLATEAGMTVDEAGFDAEMNRQRERARKAGKFTMSDAGGEADWTVVAAADSTAFVGYETTALDTHIHKVARRNGHYHVVLAETPFYAESGGQVGDRGVLRGNGFELRVIDTQKEQDHTVCICPADGEVDFGDGSVHAAVDPDHRQPTVYNHTATHLLHAALRQVLGDHVRQAGSLVAPDHLRFDFTHFRKVEAAELAEIERIVNARIQDDLAVDYFYTEFDKAREAGAMALFGEKYGDTVRVVNIPPFSMELCGGCHVRQTGEIGIFMIVQETSVAAGVRRIEAISGPKAVAAMQHHRDLVHHLSGILNSGPEEIGTRVEELLEHNRHLEKELHQVRAGQVLQEADAILDGADTIGDIRLVIREFENVEVDLLKQLGDQLRTKGDHLVGFLVNRAGDKVNFVCLVTDDLIKEKGLKAGDLVRDAAKLAGGGGGGRPHLATAGAKNAAALPDVYAFLREKLTAI